MTRNLKAIVVLVAATFLGVVHAAQDCGASALKADLDSKFPGLAIWESNCFFTMRIAPTRAAHINLADGQGQEDSVDKEGNYANGGGISVSGPKNSEHFIAKVKRTGNFLSPELADWRNPYQAIPDAKEKAKLLKRWEITELSGASLDAPNCHGLQADGAMVQVCGNKFVVKTASGKSTFSKDSGKWALMSEGTNGDKATKIETDGTVPDEDDDLQIGVRSFDQNVPMPEKKPIDRATTAPKAKDTAPAAPQKDMAGAAMAKPAAGDTSKGPKQPTAGADATQKDKKTMQCGPMKILNDLPAGSVNVAPGPKQCKLIVPMGDTWKLDVVLTEGAIEAFVYDPASGNRHVAVIHADKFGTVHENNKNGADVIDTSPKVIEDLRQMGLHKKTSATAVIQQNCQVIQLGRQKREAQICKKQAMFYADSNPFKIKQQDGMWMVTKLNALTN